MRNKKNPDEVFTDKTLPARNSMYLDAAMRNAGQIGRLGVNTSSPSAPAVPLPSSRVGLILLIIIHVVCVFWVNSWIQRGNALPLETIQATVTSVTENLVFVEAPQEDHGSVLRGNLYRSRVLGSVQEGDVLSLYIHPEEYRSETPDPETNQIRVEFIPPLDVRSPLLEKWAMGILCGLVVLLDTILVICWIRRRRAAAAPAGTAP